MSGADLWVLYARRLVVQHELARCYATISVSLSRRCMSWALGQSLRKGLRRPLTNLRQASQRMLAEWSIWHRPTSRLTVRPFLRRFRKNGAKPCIER